MSENNENLPNGMPDPEDLRRIWQEMLNQGLDPEALAEAAGFDGSPESMQAMFANIQGAFINQGSIGDASQVNWGEAAKKAKEIAAAGALALDDQSRKKILDAIGIANLWLNEATEISSIALEPKLLSRMLWVDDAMPLFREMAEPVADRMNQALAEAIQSQLPEEFAESLKSAGELMRAAGAMMFAMQLGQALGQLSREALYGSEIGLPIYQDQRPAFVVQNMIAFAQSLELGLDADQAYIFLVLREMAHARLFKHSRWLREKVVAQIREYASGITLDTSKMTDIAEEYDPQNPEELRIALETGAFLSQRTDAQQQALDRIETNLALIEGWVDAVSNEAARRLPKGGAVQEAIRRRRATGGPAERTFATLVGLELRPKRLREAAELWRQIGAAVGNDRRDALWNHPDLLPTSADIDQPAAFVARLKSELGIGDAMDQALRDLLDE